MRHRPKPESSLANAEHFIFIPSAQTGPYLIHLDGLSDTTARVAFGARIPKGALARSPALSRPELLVRLTGLADDVRLRVLELLA